MVNEAVVQALFWIGLAMWGIGEGVMRNYRRGRSVNSTPLLRRDFK